MQELEDKIFHDRITDIIKITRRLSGLDARNSINKKYSTKFEVQTILNLYSLTFKYDYPDNFWETKKGDVSTPESKRLLEDIEKEVRRSITRDLTKFMYEHWKTWERKS